MRRAVLTALLGLALPLALLASEPASVIGRELAGGRQYSPSNSQFFVDAVHEIGVVPAVFATADRMTRNSVIGSALRTNRNSQGRIEEGVQPYILRKKSSSCQIQENIYQAPAAIYGSKPVSEDFEFVNYLVDNRMAAEAVAYLENSGFQPSDTLSYLLGWSCYSANALEKAVGYFAAVPQESAFFEKSLFFAVACSAHLGRYADGLALLDSYQGGMSELRSYEVAGLSLLEGSNEAYAQAAEDFTFSTFALTGGEKLMNDIYAGRQERGKSPFVAAAMSAIIPGSGKIYAGRLDEGVASLLTVGVLAGITAENWIKNGITDWRTILFGSLSSIFYIGNIYGSYVSVGLYNTDSRNAQNTAIVYNIHIPLRSIFN